LNFSLVVFVVLEISKFDFNVKHPPKLTEY